MANLSQLEDNIAQIKQLPCFVGDIASACSNGSARGDDFFSVEPISAGLSHRCFGVSITTLTDTKTYFVKSLTGHEDTSINEVSSARLAMTESITPKVIYSCREWLVTDFISGQMLAANDIPVEEKIALSMPLLAELHQIKSTRNISSLSIQQIVNSQIGVSKLSFDKQLMLQTLCQQILTFDEGDTKVLCHGDVNFSNILIDRQDKAWLIDFECSFIGCAEFDLAMFIAVNNLPMSQLPTVISHYQCALAVKADEMFNGTLNEVLIHSYLACCYLINGIWYQNNAVSREVKAQHLALARQQYQAFDQLNLSPLKLVNFLT